MDTDLLLQKLNLIQPLSRRIQERLADSLAEEHYPRKHRLLSQGQVCRRIYFIGSGFARAWYLNPDGRECTSWFMRQGDFMISVYSFFTQEPAPENIELLEDSGLLSLSWTALQGLYADFPEFNLIGRKITEMYYILSEQRQILLRQGSPLERYELLLKMHPDILQRVSLKIIASHLNVTHEGLCRIRARQGNPSFHQH